MFKTIVALVLVAGSVFTCDSIIDKANESMDNKFIRQEEVIEVDEHHYCDQFFIYEYGVTPSREGKYYKSVIGVEYYHRCGQQPQEETIWFNH